MSKYKWKDIAWWDLLLVPIVIVASLLFGILTVIISVTFFNMDHESLLTSSYGLAAQVTASALAYIVVIISFYLLHFRTMGQRFMNGLRGIRQYVFWIVGAYLIAQAVSWIYSYLQQWLPEQFQYDTTQNEIMINQLFSISWFTPINFMMIVILAPVVEEIFFRHILIGELGKKLNFKVMAVVSVLLFAGVHVIQATSPFEIIDYLILAIPLVFLYMKSGRNLGVSIAFHMLNNFISFVVTLMQ
ncbi:CPBP family intramembrane glutamic endopeptidase [Staphylococcus cornubiensis]|uniref:CPBP family intramembrane glutamic endopeptidase n=1 Tax=Staphylococcus cornubiensis TaxID=1986155 RepID=UPI000A37F5CD|nr:type II CAAX endopeptidase family protein [Staphylococcus cornubiensis]